MWKSLTGRSSERSAPAESSKSQRSKDDDDSGSTRRRAESVSTSKSGRNLSKTENGFKPMSTSYSSTTRSAYAGTAAPSVASSYATADTRNRDSSSYRPADLIRNESMAKRVPKQIESGRERGEERRRRDRSSSQEAPRDRKDKDRRRTSSLDRDDLRKERKSGSDKRRKERGESYSTTRAPDFGTSNGQPSNLDSHIQSQFPGEFPGTFSEAYRPPGFAADYYGDQGESVHQQPGIRPTAPSVIVGAEPHLYEPTVQPEPPTEPSEMGHVGEAAAFYSMANNGAVPQVSGSSKPSKPGKQSKPSRPSKTSRPSIDNRPSPRGSPSFPPATMAGASAGVAAGLAADYYNTHHDSTSQYQETVYQSTGPGGQQYGRPEKPTSSSNVPLYGAAAAAGLAAGSYYAGQHGSHNQSYNNTYNSPYNVQSGGGGGMATPMMHRHKHRGPVSKVVDFFRDPDGVAEFEEYTEYIGVCRYCFEPGSSPRDAPRRHHHKRRSGGSKYGSTERVDKLRRYASISSDEERRKRSNGKSWLAAGVAGYGLNKLFNNRDFDDTYSVKSGRQMRPGDDGFREDSKTTRVESPYETDTKRSERRTASGRDTGLRYQDVAAAEAALASGSRSHRQKSRSPKYKSRSTADPLGSYVDLSRTKKADTGLSSFFTAPTANRSKSSKKKNGKGLFTFNNASSSSSDADLAFGAGYVKRKGSKREKERRKDDNVDAAILGLGATAVALAAAGASRDRKDRRPADVYAVRESRDKYGKKYNGRSDQERKDAADGWEDAESDHESVDSGLVYGVTRRGSRSSMGSNDSGTDKWNWRWRNDKKDKKRGSRTGDAALAGMAAAEYRRTGRDDRADSIASSHQPLQQLFPMPTSDPTLFDTVRHNSTDGPVVSRPSQIPLQQPQPVVPVGPQVYDSNGHAPFDVSREPFTESPTQIGQQLVLRNRDDTSVDRESRSEKKSHRRRETSPAALSSREALGGSALSRTTSTKDRQQSVTWDLPEDSRSKKEDEAYREEKRRRKEEREERRARRKSDPKPSSSELGDRYEEIEPKPQQLTREEEIDRELHRLYEEELKQANADKERKSSSSWVAPAVAGTAAAGAAAIIVAESNKKTDEDVQAPEVKRDRKSRRTREEELRSESIDDNKPQRSESLQRRLAKLAAERIKASPSPSHEDYGTFFAPVELREGRKQHKDASESRSSSVPVFEVVPRFVEMIPAAPAFKFPEDLYRQFGLDPDDDPTNFPWVVPQLRLVEPSPVASVAGSVRGSVSSPVNEPLEKEVDNEEPHTVVVEGAPHEAPSRVAWGEPGIIEYEAPDRGSERNEAIDPHDDARYDSPPSDASETTKARRKARRQRDLEGEHERDADLPSEGDTTLPRGDGAHDGAPDIDFAATLAAGAALGGFDPEIVINDPTYHRRVSPPGSEVTKVAREVDSSSPRFTEPQYEYAEGEAAEIPKEAFEEPKLSKKERRKLEKAAKRAAEMNNDQDIESHSAEPEIVKIEPAREERHVPGGFDDFDAYEGTTPVPEVSRQEDIVQDAIPHTSRSGAHDPRLADLIAEDAVSVPLPASEVGARSDVSKSNGARDYFGDVPAEDVPLPASEVGRSSDVSRTQREDDFYAGQTPEEESPINWEDTSSRKSKKKKKSKRTSEIFEDDAVSVAASAPGFDEFESGKKSRSKSKRDSQVFDDDNTSVVSSPVTRREEAELQRKSKDKKSAGLFGSLFGVVKAAQGAEDKKDNDNDTRSTISEPRNGGNDDFEESSRRRKKKSRDRGFDDVVSEAMDQSEVGKEVSQNGEPLKEERPEMPAGNEGVSGPEIPSPPHSQSIATPPSAGATARSRSVSPPPSSRMSIEPMTPAPDPMGNAALMRRRRLSEIRTGDVYSSPLSGISPTAVPLHFRRVPKSPSHSRQGSTNEAELESPQPDTPLSLPRTKKERPKSTEFRSSKEFRPLYLLERQASSRKPREEADTEEDYPELPPSGESSANPSVEDLSALAREQDSPSFARTPHQGWFSDEGQAYWARARPASPDYLGSQQTTPTAATFPTSVKKDKPKYEFHSPSELLQEPQYEEEEQQQQQRPMSPMVLPRSESTDSLAPRSENGHSIATAPEITPVNNSMEEAPYVLQDEQPVEPTEQQQLPEEEHNIVDREDARIMHSEQVEPEPVTTPRDPLEDTAVERPTEDAKAQPVEQPSTTHEVDAVPGESRQEPPKSPSFWSGLGFGAAAAAATALLTRKSSPTSSEKVDVEALGVPQEDNTIAAQPEDQSETRDVPATDSPSTEPGGTPIVDNQAEASSEPPIQPPAEEEDEWALPVRKSSKKDKKKKLKAKAVLFEEPILEQTPSAANVEDQEEASKSPEGDSQNIDTPTGSLAQEPSAIDEAFERAKAARGLHLDTSLEPAQEEVSAETVEPRDGPVISSQGEPTSITAIDRSEALEATADDLWESPVTSKSKKKAKKGKKGKQTFDWNEAPEQSEPAATQSNQIRGLEDVVPAKQEQLPEEPQTHDVTKTPPGPEASRDIESAQDFTPSDTLPADVATPTAGFVELTLDTPRDSSVPTDELKELDLAPTLETAAESEVAIPTPRDERDLETPTSPVLSHSPQLETSEGPTEFPATDKHEASRDVDLEEDLSIRQLPADESVIETAAPVETLIETPLETPNDFYTPTEDQPDEYSWAPTTKKSKKGKKKAQSSASASEVTTPVLESIPETPIETAKEEPEEFSWAPTALKSKKDKKKGKASALAFEEPLPALEPVIETPLETPLETAQEEVDDYPWAPTTKKSKKDKKKGKAPVLAFGEPAPALEEPVLGTPLETPLETARGEVDDYSWAPTTTKSKKSKKNGRAALLAEDSEPSTSTLESLPETPLETAKEEAGDFDWSGNNEKREETKDLAPTAAQTDLDLASVAAQNEANLSTVPEVPVEPSAEQKDLDLASIAAQEPGLGTVPDIPVEPAKEQSADEETKDFEPSAEPNDLDPASVAAQNEANLGTVPEVPVTPSAEQNDLDLASLAVQDEPNLSTVPEKAAEAAKEEPEDVDWAPTSKKDKKKKKKRDSAFTVDPEETATPPPEALPVPETPLETPFTPAQTEPEEFAWAPASKKDKKKKKRDSALVLEPEETATPPSESVPVPENPIETPLEPAQEEPETFTWAPTTKKGRKDKKKKESAFTLDPEETATPPSESVTVPETPVEALVETPLATAQEEPEDLTWAPTTKKGKKDKKKHESTFTLDPEETTPTPSESITETPLETAREEPDEFSWAPTTKKGKKDKKKRESAFALESEETATPPSESIPIPGTPLEAPQEVAEDLPEPVTETPLETAREEADEFSWAPTTKKGKKDKKKRESTFTLDLEEAATPPPELVPVPETPLKVPQEAAETPLETARAEPVDEFSWAPTTKKGKKDKKKRESAFALDPEETPTPPESVPVPETPLETAQEEAEDFAWAPTTKKGKKDKKKKKLATQAWEDPQSESPGPSTNAQPYEDLMPRQQEESEAATPIPLPPVTEDVHAGSQTPGIPAAVPLPEDTDRGFQQSEDLGEPDEQDIQTLPHSFTSSDVPAQGTADEYYHGSLPTVPKESHEPSSEDRYIVEESLAHTHEPSQPPITSDTTQREAEVPEELPIGSHESGIVEEPLEHATRDHRPAQEQQMQRDATAEEDKHDLPSIIAATLPSQDVSMDDKALELSSDHPINRASQPANREFGEDPFGDDTATRAVDEDLKPTFETPAEALHNAEYPFDAANTEPVLAEETKDEIDEWGGFSSKKEKKGKKGKKGRASAADPLTSSGTTTPVNVESTASDNFETPMEQPDELSWAAPTKKSKKDKKKSKQVFDDWDTPAETATPIDTLPAEEASTEAAPEVEATREVQPDPVVEDEWSVPSKKSKKDKKKSKRVFDDWDTPAETKNPLESEPITERAVIEPQAEERQGLADDNTLSAGEVGTDAAPEVEATREAEPNPVVEDERAVPSKKSKKGKKKKTFTAWDDVEEPQPEQAAATEVPAMETPTTEYDRNAAMQEQSKGPHSQIPQEDVLAPEPVQEVQSEPVAAEDEWAVPSRTKSKKDKKKKRQQLPLDFENDASSRSEPVADETAPAFHDALMENSVPAIHEAPAIEERAMEQPRELMQEPTTSSDLDVPLDARSAQIEQHMPPVDEPQLADEQPATNVEDFPSTREPAPEMLESIRNGREPPYEPDTFEQIPHEESRSTQEPNADFQEPTSASEVPFNIAREQETQTLADEQPLPEENKPENDDEWAIPIKTKKDKKKKKKDLADDSGMSTPVTEEPYNLAREPEPELSSARQPLEEVKPGNEEEWGFPVKSKKDKKKKKRDLADDSGMFTPVTEEPAFETAPATDVLPETQEAKKDDWDIPIKSKKDKKKKKRDLAEDSGMSTPLTEEVPIDAIGAAEPFGEEPAQVVDDWDTPVKSKKDKKKKKRDLADDSGMSTPLTEEPAFETASAAELVVQEPAEAADEWAIPTTSKKGKNKKKQPAFIDFGEEPSETIEPAVEEATVDRAPVVEPEIEREMPAEEGNSWTTVTQPTVANDETVPAEEEWAMPTKKSKKNKKNKMLAFDLSGEPAESSSSVAGVPPYTEAHESADSRDIAQEEPTSRPVVDRFETAAETPHSTSAVLETQPTPAEDDWTTSHQSRLNENEGKKDISMEDELSTPAQHANEAPAYDEIFPPQTSLAEQLQAAPQGEAMSASTDLASRAEPEVQDPIAEDEWAVPTKKSKKDKKKKRQSTFDDFQEPEVLTEPTAAASGEQVSKDPIESYEPSQERSQNPDYVADEGPRATMASEEPPSTEHSTGAGLLSLAGAAAGMVAGAVGLAHVAEPEDGWAVPSRSKSKKDKKTKKRMTLDDFDEQPEQVVDSSQIPLPSEPVNREVVLDDVKGPDQEPVAEEVEREGAMQHESAFQLPGLQHVSNEPVAPPEYEDRAIRQSISANDPSMNPDQERVGMEEPDEWSSFPAKKSKKGKKGRKSYAAEMPDSAEPSIYQTTEEPPQGTRDISMADVATPFEEKANPWGIVHDNESKQEPLPTETALPGSTAPEIQEPIVEDEWAVPAKKSKKDKKKKRQVFTDWEEPVEAAPSRRSPDVEDPFNKGDFAAAAAAAAAAVEAAGTLSRQNSKGSNLGGSTAVESRGLDEGDAPNPSVIRPRRSIFGPFDDENQTMTTGPSAYDRHEQPQPLRDSAIHMEDSPLLSQEPFHQENRDSGYVPSPILPSSHDARNDKHLRVARPPRPLSPTSSSEDVRPRAFDDYRHSPSTHHESQRHNENAEPMHVDVEVDPAYNVAVSHGRESPERTRELHGDMSSPSSKGHTTYTPERIGRQPSPVDSTSKDRSSGLFDSSPSNRAAAFATPESIGNSLRRPPSGLRRSPSIHGHHGSHEGSLAKAYRDQSPTRSIPSPVSAAVPAAAPRDKHFSFEGPTVSPPRTPLGTIVENEEGLPRDLGAKDKLRSQPPATARSRRNRPEVIEASSSTYDPVKDKGKGQARDMASVSYDGWGEAPGSPLSPTRPASVRRRRSMQQIQDLEARLDQLASENRLLATQKITAEKQLEDLSFAHGQNENALGEIQSREMQLRQKDADIERLMGTLTNLQREVERLSQVNDGLTSANSAIASQHEAKYNQLQYEHNNTREQWRETSRELDNMRDQHHQLSAGMEDIVKHEINTALAEKNHQIERLQYDLEVAKNKIRELQQQIMAQGSDEVVQVRDEDYFENACQSLCGHVKNWVMKFSKFSDTRVCRSISEVRDEKIVDRFDNAILDGSEVDSFLMDRVKRRDVFMSVVMTMIFEFIFSRYLFGMDREQRQKIKQLEKQLTEIGPPAAVNRWRALTLTLLAKRPSFQAQRANDTEAVVLEIYNTLAKFLPPPRHLEDQIQESLRSVMRAAVDLSVEMRTQKAEYIMLPPLQPEYDTNGDLARKVYFNAALMNERSGETTSNEELEQAQAVIRIVLFPLVVKRGLDNGDGDEEIVVCPAQVLVARPDREKGKRNSRVLSGGQSVHSLALSTMDMSNVI